MSRKLTYLLLAANLVFFLWAVYGQRPAHPQRRSGADLALERIVLVTESPRSAGKTARTEAAAPSRPPAAPTPPARTKAPPPPCYRIGPFNGRRTPVRLLTQFLQLGLPARVIEVEAGEPSGYWLMYPPAPDLATARRNLARLRALGLKDLWLFEQGRWRGAISLGLYAQRSRAEAMAARLRAQGIEVEVRPRHGGERRYWVEARAEPFPGWRAALAAWGWAVRPCAQSAADRSRQQ